MTLGNVVVRLLRATLPVVTLYVGKLILDEVVRLIGVGAPPAETAAWLPGGELHMLARLLAAELGLAVLADVLGRATGLLACSPSDSRTPPACASWSTPRRSTSRTSRTASCRTSSTARGARPSGRSPLMGQLFGQAQDVVTDLSFARA
jgi:ATP-binding cassette subfamily B protein